MKTRSLISERLRRLAEENPLIRPLVEQHARRTVGLCSKGSQKSMEQMTYRLAIHAIKCGRIDTMCFNDYYMALEGDDLAPVTKQFFYERGAKAC